MFVREAGGLHEDEKRPLDAGHNAAHVDCHKMEKALRYEQYNSSMRRYRIKPTLVTAVVVTTVIIAGDVFVAFLLLVAVGAAVILASLFCKYRRATAEVRGLGHAC